MIFNSAIERVAKSTQLKSLPAAQMQVEWGGGDSRTNSDPEGGLDWGLRLGIPLTHMICGCFEYRGDAKISKMQKTHIILS